MATVRRRSRDVARRTEVIGDATLILGDCVEVLPTLPRVDAVVTDPPYGIEWDYESYNDSFLAWGALVDAILPVAISLSKVVVIAVGPIEAERHIFVNHNPRWRVCWYRGSTGARCPVGFRDWESNFMWGAPPQPMHDHFHAVPELRDLGHSCPKPVEWGKWFVSRLAQINETVLDPFMGSGTTGVACLRLGRKFIGIEIDEKYFDIACRRIEDEYRKGDFLKTRLRMSKQSTLIVDESRRRVRR